MGTGINLTAFAAEAARLRRRSIIMRIRLALTMSYFAPVWDTYRPLHVHLSDQPTAAFEKFF
jgi:hypothetical protein